MKKGLAFILAVIFMIACQSDPSKQIIGEWEIVQASVANMDEYLSKFKEKFNASDEEVQREKERISTLPMSYYPVGITMEFADSSKYYMGGIEGEWIMKPDNNTIEVHFSSIDTANFVIRKISKNDLVLSYQTEFSGLPLDIELVLKRVKKD